MAYELYDNPCEDEIIEPVCDPCSTPIEKARVRGVAFIHKSIIADFKSDPTNASNWADGKAAKLIYEIPATQGSYDGGSPVEGAGYGDQATKITGYNFVLQYKDPTLAPNFDFYNTIKHSSGWYIAFRTETLTRISDNPVTIAPKDPVVDDINGDVIWDNEVKWSGDHTKPFETPDGAFTCEAAAPSVPFTFRFGTGTTPADDGEVNAGTAGTAAHNAKAVVPDFGNGADDFLWYAEPVTEPVKVVWYNTVTNNGAIGAGETFLAPVVVGTFRLYVSGFATSFDTPTAVEFRTS